MIFFGHVYFNDYWKRIARERRLKTENILVKTHCMYTSIYILYTILYCMYMHKIWIINWIWLCPVSILMIKYCTILHTFQTTPLAILNIDNSRLSFQRYRLFKSIAWMTANQTMARDHSVSLTEPEPVCVRTIVWHKESIV